MEPCNNLACVSHCIIIIIIIIIITIIITIISIVIIIIRPRLRLALSLLHHPASIIIKLKCIGCCVPEPCDVKHCKLAAARGLLSFLSFLRAFLLNVIKRNASSAITIIIIIIMHRNQA